MTSSNSQLSDLRLIVLLFCALVPTLIKMELIIPWDLLHTATGSLKCVNIHEVFRTV
jgi:hypothetical protein